LLKVDFQRLGFFSVLRLSQRIEGAQHRALVISIDSSDSFYCTCKVVVFQPRTLVERRRALRM
ncbi:MAG: hypothetical protein AAGJ35_10445, partial [Myxococcota bacterium]